MIGQYIVIAIAFIGMFILFLVLGKTLNSIINQMTRLEYFLGKERDLQKEMVVITQMLKDKNAAQDQEPEKEKA